MSLLENLLFAAAVFVICSVMGLTLLLLIEAVRTIVP